jgi:hypothetical protein
MADNKRVFISYSADDRKFADALREALTSHHTQVLDPAVMDPGENPIDFMEQTLRSSDVFVYVIPEKEGSGKSSLIELGAAKALGKKIVAVLQDSGRVANSEVAAKLADSLLLDQSPNDIARKILEAA